MHSAVLCKRKFCYYQVWKIPLIHFFILTAITAGFLLVPFIGKSQNISIAVESTSLEKVFRIIEKQSSYRFVYSEETLEKANPVSIKMQNAFVKDVLNLCFKNQPLTFSMNEQIIVIQSRNVKKATADTVTNQIIRGRVVNEQGEGLEGVTVAIKGQNHATATDAYGNFLLRSRLAKGILVLSNVGYRTEEVAYIAKSPVFVKLTGVVNKLDETVVIGYGTTTRRLNTGSVSRVTADEIGIQPVSNPIAALEGRVTGLFITQGNGLPGSNFTVRLRGRNSIQSGNSPLYIIDGVPFLNDAEQLTQRSGINANSPFNSINPEDIESIELLKDADATAIYGSRGANGVILITTKKGSAGKTKLDVSSYAGWGKVTRTMKYMNTQEYLQMRREAFKNDGVTPDINNAPDLFAWDTTRYVDWKKLLIGNTAHSQNTHIRLSGGNNNTNFSFGSSYYRESTVFPGDLADQRTTFDLSVSHHSSDSKFYSTISAMYGSDRSNLIGQDLTQNINVPPNMYLPYDSSGKLRWSEGGVSYGNPLSFLEQKYKGVTSRMTGSALFSYKVLPSLSIKATFGFNNINFSEALLDPISSQNPADNPLGSSTFANNEVKTWIAEPQAEYTHNFGKGRLSILGGATWQQTINSSGIVSGEGYTNDDLLNSITGASSVTATNNYSQYRYEAVFGRINYQYDTKYLINITGRRDGSTRFGPGKQFAFFPAVGVGWIFSKEKDIHNFLPFLSYGKLRGSYGLTGNDQINNYQYLDTWTGTQYTYQNQPGLRPTRLFNPDYNWERNRKLEGGLELGFLNDRILFTGSYFLNRSDNQIIQYNLPAQTGFSTILKNFPGTVQNKGFEIEIRSDNVKNSSFNWTSSFNLSVNRNKLVSFPGLESSSYSSSYVIGQPLNISKGYDYTGIDQQKGIYQFKDVNKDGTIDYKDYILIKSYDPAFFGGLQNHLQYKQFQLDFLFQFVKQEGRNAIYSSLVNVPGTVSNQPADLINRWQKPGDVTSYAMYTEDFTNPAYLANYKIAISNAVVTDASYIRLKNVHFSYSLPSGLIKKYKVDKCSLYFEAQNLLTITKYKGPDPETQNISSLPPLRMMTAGIQLTF